MESDFPITSDFRSQGEEGEENVNFASSASVINVSNRFMNFVGNLGIHVNLRKSAGATCMEQRHKNARNQAQQLIFNLDKNQE